MRGSGRPGAGRRQRGWDLAAERNGKGCGRLEFGTGEGARHFSDAPGIEAPEKEQASEDDKRGQKAAPGAGPAIARVSMF